MKRNLYVNLLIVLVAIFVFIIPNKVSAHGMPDDWRQSDYVGYNYLVSGGYVQAVQRMLLQSGFGYSAVDGYYGPDTNRGIRGFQTKHGLSADGIVGPQTWGEFQKYRVYIGYRGTMRIYNYHNDLLRVHARYERDACYGWSVDISSNNNGNFWRVIHGFQKRDLICL